MQVEHTSHITAVGTLTGTALTVTANIIDIAHTEDFKLYGVSTEDIIKTAVLAFIGAVVSFLVSLFLKWSAKKVRQYVSRF